MKNSFADDDNIQSVFCIYILQEIQVLFHKTETEKQPSLIPEHYSELDKDRGQLFFWITCQKSKHIASS